MLITSAALLLIFPILLYQFRNGWFVLHACIILGISLALERFYVIEQFHRDAFAIFMAIHLFSINLVMFLMYYMDKRAASKGGWRIPEKVLHAFSLVGGTPSAYIAMKKLRHKTIKKSFKDSFIIVILMQIIVLAMAIFFYM